MSKTTYCGMCEHFRYEDIDGYGQCSIDGKVRFRGEKCAKK